MSRWPHAHQEWKYWVIFYPGLPSSQLMSTWWQERWLRDFPGGTVDKKLPVNAWDMGSIPGLGRSHKVQRTDPIITTAEPTLWSPRCNCWGCLLQLPKPTHLEPVLCNKRGHHKGKPMHYSGDECPCSPQLEKALQQQRRPRATKN